MKTDQVQQLAKSILLFLQVKDNYILNTKTFGRLFKKEESHIQAFSICLASGSLPTVIEVAPQKLYYISTM